MEVKPENREKGIRLRQVGNETGKDRRGQGETKGREEGRKGKERKFILRTILVFLFMKQERVVNE